MKKVAFLRHAKSDWSDAFQADIDRALAERGRNDAPRMGAWISARLSLDLAVVSPAKRAQETFKATEIDIRFETDDRLYPTQSGNVKRILSALSDEISNVLVVGHNPGISNAVHNFLQAATDDPKLEEMPTCACAILEFPSEKWSEIDFSSANLCSFMTPKRLK